MNTQVKVSFKHCNIMFQLKNWTYSTFCQKIKQRFELKNNEYYQLSFINHQEKNIFITNQKQLDQFCQYFHQRKSRLQLKETKDAKLHFQGTASNFSTAQERNKEVQDEINQLKEEMRYKLEQFKKETKLMIERQLRAQLSIKKLRKKSEVNNTIHYGFECRQCLVPEIRGARYECAICEDYSICEECQQNGYQHTSTHPLIKIKDQTQMLMEKKNILKKERKGEMKPSKKKKEVEVEKEQKCAIDSQFIKNVSELFDMSQEKAQQFIQKHPGKGLQQLVNIYYS